MTNIWGFLLQSTSVSLVILLLLLVKRIFVDKLSARFQYLIWSILALRILIPTNIMKTTLIPFSLTLETLKSITEKGLSSVYSSRFEPISLSSVFPVIKEKPESITDILFCIYASGIVLYSLYYLFSYLRLRILLFRAEKASSEEQEMIDTIAKIYGLKSCKAVYIDGISSAFVCGIIRPLLVLPADKETDEKIILHELLHLKYKDALQNVLWCLLRALHWCNPLVHVAAHRIGNDMESLCDTRVLERLEGEERREYGKILLDMANTKYARAPFTSSISNGGKQISKRIEAIVRFKKFPKGMMIAAICITVFLCFPTLLGTRAIYTEDYYPGGYADLSAWEEERTLALVRLNRCTTIAGALDTYAKGLMYQNGYYIATASPISSHEEMSADIQNSVEWSDVSFRGSYTVANLYETEKDHYSALLLFDIQAFNEETNTPYSVLLIPVFLQYENGGFSVTENGERVQYPYGMTSFYLSQETDDPFSYPYISRKEYKTKLGTLIIEQRDSYTIKNTVQRHSIMTELYSYNTSLNTSAEFQNKWDNTLWIYKVDNDIEQPTENITIVRKYLNSPTEKYQFHEQSIYTDGYRSWSIGYEEQGKNDPIGQNWEGYIKDQESIYFEDIGDSFATNTAVRIYFDGELAEEFIITEDGNVTQIK
ncbi:MAG: hypothetical protein IJ489_04925 [Clostridia bacterium]|nr:hypothetical protein [Clostridia bacterium]